MLLIPVIICAQNYATFRPFCISAALQYRIIKRNVPSLACINGVNSTYKSQQSENCTASIPGAFRWYYTSFMRGASDRLSHEFVIENALSPVYDKFSLKHEYIFRGAKEALYSPWEFNVLIVVIINADWRVGERKSLT